MLFKSAVHQPQAGERAGTSLSNAKIVVKSPGARLCRTMITPGGKGDNEENKSDNAPHYPRPGKEPGLHIVHILDMKLLIAVTNSCFIG